MSVEIIDVDGNGANAWSSVGKAIISGVAQTSNALLEIVDEGDSFALENAEEEIAVTLQRNVVEENASVASYVASDLVQDLFGPHDLRKKARRPLNLL